VDLLGFLTWPPGGENFGHQVAKTENTKSILTPELMAG
jgi:hypothetical protein